MKSSPAGVATDKSLALHPVECPQSSSKDSTRQLSFCPSPNKASVASRKCWYSSSSVLSLVPFLAIGLPVFVGP